MAEKGMDSLDKKCNDLKHAYDSCFNTWFSETFLKGGGGGQGNGDSAQNGPRKTLKTPCDAMLKAYSDCVKAAMRARNMDPIIFTKYWEDAAEIKPEDAKTDDQKNNKSYM